MMSYRLFQLFLIVPCLLLSGVSTGQMIEENESEHIQQQADQATGSESAPDLAEVATGIVSQTNDFRHHHDRRTVEVNPKLKETAQYFADFMARTDQYGHHADGKGPADRARNHGYDFCIVSENIAYQFSSAGFATEELTKGFVQGWEQSPGHRKNMLDPDVTEIGVALAQSEQSGNYYAVQMFGRPRSMSIEFKLTNHADVTVEYALGDRTYSLPPRYTRTHQGCRLGELSVHWPGSQGSEAVHPTNGDHYRIERDESGRFRLSGA